ncbi:MAG: hypothetical protein LBO03_09220 [Acidaminococcales bacterium]|nr:hypothetical protein [Acidaminococcales bacterium]
MGFSDMSAEKKEKDRGMEIVLSLLGHGNLGTELDKMPNGVGPFGLAATNPVPTCGIRGARAYLDNLFTDTGRKLKYVRRGSTSIQNIDVGYIVDIYDLFDKNTNDRIGTIYICPYNKKNSTEAPAGFCLKSAGA